MEKKKEVIEKLDAKQASQKLSYEQLNEIATQLTNRNRQLEMQLKELYVANATKRIDYLFELLKQEELFPQEVTLKAISEISEALFPKEEDSTENE